MLKGLKVSKAAEELSISWQNLSKKTLSTANWKLSRTASQAVKSAK
jgi:hypothetical protein